MAEYKIKEYNIDDMPGYSREELMVKVADVLMKETRQLVSENSAPVVPSNGFYVRYGKRMIDVVLSGIALILTLPINAVLAVCTYFDVGSPIIFKQKRVGKDGELFTIYKFRNMTNDRDEKGELLPPAERVTKFGSFVRRTSLDELLNFWSVFCGDMSLIGPRPLAVRYQDRYSDRHKCRCAVKPGLECPAIWSEDGIKTWNAQFENEIYYVEHVSFALDVKMAFALVGLVFNRKRSAQRGAAMRGSFMGYDRNGEAINSKHVPAEYLEKALGVELEKE